MQVLTVEQIDSVCGGMRAYEVGYEIGWATGKAVVIASVAIGIYLAWATA